MLSSAVAVPGATCHIFPAQCSRFPDKLSHRSLTQASCEQLLHTPSFCFSSLHSALLRVPRVMLLCAAAVPGASWHLFSAQCSCSSGVCSQRSSNRASRELSLQTPSFRFLSLHLPLRGVLRVVLLCAPALPGASWHIFLAQRGLLPGRALPEVHGPSLWRAASADPAFVFHHCPRPLWGVPSVMLLGVAAVPGAS